MPTGGSGDPSTRAGGVAVELVADPGLPSDIAQDIADRLPEALRRTGATDNGWTFDVAVRRLAADEHGQVSLRELVRSTGTDPRFDLHVALTDQPRRAGVRPIVADVSTSSGAALASLPAMGALRLRRRSRDAVVEVLRELVREERDPERRFGPWRRTRWRVHSEGPGDIDDDVDVRFLGTSRHTKLRLVAGMVRANRPWRLVPELSGAFAAALATGAYVLITQSVWELADALGPLRLAAAAVLAVVAMVAWLIIDHEMWERPEDPEDRELAVLYNATTVITVAIGVGCLYVGLFVLGLVADRIFVEDGILRETLGRPVTWWDHLTVVWMASSMATVAGALGTGFSSDEAVRKAAYGFRQRERRAAQETAAEGEEEDGG